MHEIWGYNLRAPTNVETRPLGQIKSAININVYCVEIWLKQLSKYRSYIASSCIRSYVRPVVLYVEFWSRQMQLRQYIDNEELKTKKN